jgi:YfiH family protein
MIRPDGFLGAAFGTVAEGDLRVDDGTRRRVSADLGISPDWAYVTQVHGSTIIHVDRPGNRGEADGLFTTTRALPVTVATADCVPIILEGPGVAAVVHSGWRGAVAGVVANALRTIERAGLEVRRAAIGPSIGPCCYEVGPEVVAHFPGFESETDWGTQSIDLPAIVAAELGTVDVWKTGACTYTDPALHSYRRNRTPHRQVAVAWLPNSESTE